MILAIFIFTLPLVVALLGDNKVKAIKVED